MSSVCAIVHTTSHSSPGRDKTLTFQPPTTSRSRSSHQASHKSIYNHPTPHPATPKSCHHPKSRVSMSSTSETLTCLSEKSFYDRMPSVEFTPPTPDWGYLAQVNEKFRTVLTWDVERIVGEPAHKAMFQCTPGRSFSSAVVSRGSRLILP